MLLLATPSSSLHPRRDVLSVSSIRTFALAFGYWRTQTNLNEPMPGAGEHICRTAGQTRRPLRARSHAPLWNVPIAPVACSHGSVTSPALGARAGRFIQTG